MRPMLLLAFSLVAGPAVQWSSGAEPLPMPDSLPGDIAAEPMASDEVPPAEGEQMPAEIEPVEEHSTSDGAGILVFDPESTDDQYPTCMIDDVNIDYPLWYVNADAIWLERTAQGHLTTATIRYPDGKLGNNRISSDGFDVASGMRVFAGRNIWDGMTFIEAGYYGLFNWNNLTPLGRTNGNFGIIETNVDLGFGLEAVEPDSQTVQYDSELHNAELNVRSYFSPNFAFIGGLRYVNLSEQFVIAERGLVTLEVNNVEVPGTYFATRDIVTENSVLAPQMGMDIFRNLTDDIRLGGMARLGFGFNFSESTARQVRDGQAIDPLNFTVSDARVQYDDETAICGIVELGASAEIVLTRNVTLRGGYQFLWMHGVALATEQHVNLITDPNGPQRQIENGADLIFFGPFVGLEISWGHVDY